MSSENCQNLVTALKAEAIAESVLAETQAGKVIIPFNEARLPYGWSAADQSVSFIDLNSYQEIGEYSSDDQVITVQCGIKLFALEQFLRSNNQCLPVAYPDEQTSLLDVILTGNAGPLEIFAGGLRRHILGLTFVLSNGVISQSGGKVVKNVSGYDLTRFLIGSYGYFALPVKANLRLYSLPQQKYTLAVTGAHINDLIAAAKFFTNSGISLGFMDLLDARLVEGKMAQILGEKNNIGQKFYLLAQIWGDQFIVDAEIEMAKKFLDDLKLKYNIFIGSNEQADLLTELSRIGANGGNNHDKNCLVETVIASGDFMKLCLTKDIMAFPFLYRPACGRLFFSLNSGEQQSLLLTSLAGYANTNNKPLTVAYSDNFYIRKTAKLGNDTVGGAGTAASIEHRLKEQFDPDNVFNPFVDFA